MGGSYFGPGLGLFMGSACVAIGLSFINSNLHLSCLQRGKEEKGRRPKKTSARTTN